MVGRLWLPSYPDVVERGYREFDHAQYLPAAESFFLAAHLAQTEFHIELCLHMAWIASERAAGRRSELEPWA